MEKLILPKDGTCSWAGMGNYVILAPNKKNSIEITYISEPPHGDSYHKATVNKKNLPGYVWGCLFGSSSDSRYFVCSWMSKILERKTIVIDCVEMQYFVLPEYIYEFKITWPLIKGIGDKYKNLSYEFSGTENWCQI